MELNPAVAWTCLLLAGLALVQPSPPSATTPDTLPRPPRLIDCVFRIQSDVTCRWDPGDTRATSYTLQVQRKPSGIKFSATNTSLKTFTCTTSGTSCTAGIDHSTVRIDFCISVIAHGRTRNISSQVRCQSGRIEAVLSPAILNSVESVHRSPECLNVHWSRNFSTFFPVSNSEVKAGHLNSQIEFTTYKQPAQLDVQVSNVTVSGYEVMVCLFRPDTTYVIRLRHRYWGPASPWSPWSNAVQGRTVEDAPSAAPVLWRQVINTDMNGRRLVSLLWKPLPHFLANGRVLYYNVTCRTRSAQVLSDRGSCGDLRHPSFSCNLLLPAEYRSCALTASTSAGTSPEARLWLPGTSETEPPAPDLVTASPLGDGSLEVRWTSPPSPSVSGFVVEWFAVRDETSSVLHWETLNSSSRKLVITEGVKPMERFAVSVRALYGDRGAGRNRTVRIYTRQGAPSVGPQVQVQRISGSAVELSWTPVPVELLHGFLCNYTLFYKATNQSTRSVVVPGHVHRYTLENLSPGNHDFFVRANTAAGTGRAGNQLNVHIGSGEVSVVMSVAVPLTLTSVMLMMITCLAQMKRVKLKLQHSVPNPSKSSLSHWNPDSSFESMTPLVVQEQPDINNCRVVLPDILQDLEENNGSQSICHLLTYSSFKPSPLHVEISGKEFARCSTEAKTTSAAGFCSNHCIYSSILLSQTPENGPTPLWPRPSHQSSKPQPSAVLADDPKPPPGEASESCESPDEKETSHLFLEQQQSCVSDFHSAAHSSVLLFHPKEVSRLNMMLSHQPAAITSPDGLSGALKPSFSPFHHSVFVDLSYLTVQCDPCTSSDI